MAKPPTTLEKLAAYNLWANEQLLTYLESLPDKVPAASLRLLGHIFNAQAIWLSRILPTANAGLPFTDRTLTECRQLHQTTAAQLSNLAAWEPDKLAEIISYVNTQGEAFETSVHDILTHVFNHSTYHRAQIARDLRQNNLTPINTDFINYVRKSPTNQKI